MGSQLPTEKRHSPTQLLAHVYCGQTTVCIRIPLGTEVGLSLGDIVLDGIPVSPPLEGHSPQFSANVYCGQMAGWTKMSLGMEVGLSPGDFVFDGTQFPRKESTASPPQQGAEPPPILAYISIVAKQLYVSGYHLVRK